MHNVPVTVEQNQQHSKRKAFVFDKKMFLRKFCERPPSLVRCCSQRINYASKKIQELSEIDIGTSVKVKASIFAVRNVHTFFIYLLTKSYSDQLQGWVRNTRSMKKVFFCDVNDGSSHKNLQIVITKEKRNEMPTMGFGSSVIAAGKIDVAPKGNLELRADDFELIGEFWMFHL